MTSEPPVTLDWLTYHWGDAYLICYARDRWAALRRDTHRFLTADTLAGLTRAIEADYAASPVPRDFDPPADPGPPTTHPTMTTPRSRRYRMSWPCSGTYSPSGPSATPRTPEPGPHGTAA